ncbi:hypothetical protein [Zongyangia hominis]|uniref:Uncharacterized protein n=1 Tax=Zongyangia hominis TaxID=2763677 RepID=A0A926EFZ0_9FIRM|nr:hypothetical protein [Zongyangia hominis]MBC8571449.1 hypothetical protein [Zongyangia hominis]
MELIIGVSICILAIAVSYVLGEFFERRRREKNLVGYTCPLDGEEIPADAEEVSRYIHFAAGFMQRRHQVYGLDRGYYKRAAEQLVIYIIECKGHLPTPALVEKISEETERYFESFSEMEDVLDASPE